MRLLLFVLLALGGEAAWAVAGSASAPIHGGCGCAEAAMVASDGEATAGPRAALGDTESDDQPELGVETDDPPEDDAEPEMHHPRLPSRHHPPSTADPAWSTAPADVCIASRWLAGETPARGPPSRA